MRTRRGRATAAILGVLAMAAAAGGTTAAPPRQTTFFYESPSVTLSGVLTRHTFPGPPNYESVAKGDQPETTWVLHLTRPIRVRHKSGSGGDAADDVTDLQLALEDVSVYTRHRALLGKPVTATGGLFPAETGHHHTPVLLLLKTLRANAGAKRTAPKPARR